MSLRPALLVLALLVAACTRPPVSGDAPARADAPAASQRSAAPGASSDARSAAAPQTLPRDAAPPKSTPLPPERVEAPRGAPTLRTSCSTDADCAVKNVGSCCGAMPACVSKDSPVDPEAVKADCARRGVMSTCGFKEIQSCSCVAGTCRDAGDAATPVDR